MVGIHNVVGLNIIIHRGASLPKKSPTMNAVIKIVWNQSLENEFPGINDVTPGKRESVTKKINHTTRACFQILKNTIVKLVFANGSLLIKLPDSGSDES